MPPRATPRARSESPTPQTPGTAGTASGAPDPRVRRAMAALNTGALSVALIGGLACYAFLLGRGLAGWLAGLIGFGFALLARTALVGLGREWLLAQARRSAPPAAAPAPPTDARRRRKQVLDQPTKKG